MSDCRMNVILDLDNTIINALSDSDRKKLPSEFSDKFTYRDMIPFFRIYARPHIEEFLTYLFANFNVAVMTAAEKDYAIFIIEHFITKGKPERKLEFIFFRYQVELSREIFGGVKDLRIIWDIFQINGFNKQNTVILDDLDMVYETNPYNTLRIPGFFVVDEDNGKVNYESVNDIELLNTINKLEYIKGIYETNICKGIDKAILDISPSSKEEVNKTEEVKIEEIKEEIKEELKDEEEKKEEEA